MSAHDWYVVLFGQNTPHQVINLFLWMGCIIGAFALTLKYGPGIGRETKKLSDK